ncbi:hypothetical protein QO207_21085 [Pseudomonas sp. CAN2814]|uniref:hypothetical protein n=1 Tax=Pseudomonas sp. CAN1 TaxID=3046726 RepID=UPI002647BBEE|nr:hypothetical protein [Pseudomonas sp. CAN1]MDN6859098.1 hypothetical protein [Pseudomonas sp. CAN1]
MLDKRKLLPLALLLAGVLSLVLQYLAGNPLQVSLFNSDGLYLPTLLSDLTAHGGQLADWYLTPAPYFFPDMPMFAVAQALGHGAYRSFLMFASLQTLVLFASLWAIARLCVGRDDSTLAALATLALVGLGLAGREPFSLLFVSAYHYGIFLAALWLVFCWARFEADESRAASSGRRWLGAAAAIAFVAALSDNLFIVQALIPLLATAGVLALAQRELVLKKHLPVLALMLAGALGYGSYKFLVPHPQRYSARLGLEKLPENVSFWWHLLLDMLQQQPIFALAVLLYACAIVWSIRSLLRLPQTSAGERRLTWLVIFSAMSIGSTLATVSLLKSLPMSPRYLIPVVSWPVVIAALFLRHCAGQYFLWLGSSLSVLLAAILLANAYGTTTSRGLQQEFYPAEFACIDNALASAGARNGIAQYWDAKLLQNFSRLDLTLAQYLEQLDEMRWITSARYYRDSYDFAIVSENATPPFKLSTQAIERLNGPARQVVRCGERSVLLYGKDGLKVRQILAVGESRQWRACELPSQIGAPVEGCRVHKRDDAQVGYLTFGPYQLLSPGRYRLELDYASSAASSDSIADWDAVVALEKEARVVGKGSLVGTAGADGKLSAEFVQNVEGQAQKVEVRTFAHAGKDLEIQRLRLTRLD